jgi:hypothetical protein
MSNTSSGSGSDTLIYSPPEESPPLEGGFYTGTILDLVEDPEALREYRHLERNKEVHRRGSAASGGSGGSGSRSGSLSAGDDWVRRTSLENGKRRLPHDTSPQSRKTTLSDSWHDVDGQGRRPSLSDGNIPSPTRIHTSPNAISAPLHASPSSAHTARQPLFHPDLHPVADHSGPRYDALDAMMGKMSSSSLPENTLYTHVSSDTAGPHSRRDTFGEPTMTGDDSPSSSGTIRPPLATQDGKPKARTVADCRANEEGWSA